VPILTFSAFFAYATNSARFFAPVFSAATNGRLPDGMIETSTKSFSAS